MKVKNRQKKLSEQLVVGAFISVPAISSLISTIHLVDLFNLGNGGILAWALAIVFELGSIAAFLVPKVLPKIKSGLVYSIFVILAMLQVVGNVYFSYNFIFEKLKISPEWLVSMQDLLSFFGTFGQQETMFMVAMTIGVPIPLISLFFLKSWVEYIKIEDEPVEVETITEPVKVEEVEKELKKMVDVDEFLFDGDISWNEDIGSIDMTDMGSGPSHPTATEPGVPGVIGILQEEPEVIPKKITVKKDSPLPEIKQEYYADEDKEGIIKVSNEKNDIYLKDGQGLPLQANKAKDTNE